MRVDHTIEPPRTATSAALPPHLLQCRAMPASTLVIVIGAWLLLAALTGVAWLFNRDRGDE
jgi:hypothetical protein